MSTLTNWQKIKAHLGDIWSQMRWVLAERLLLLALKVSPDKGEGALDLAQTILAFMERQCARMPQWIAHRLERDRN